jgi:glycosyltransferase involved in cell wall biosynthesis
MRVLFLQQQPCVRALKIATGLRGALPDLELGFAYQGKTLGEYYGSGDDLFARWWDLRDDPAAELPEVLDEFGPDLVHSHNLPDSLTVLAQELAGGRVPIVHDVHDLQSLRRTPYENGFPEPGDPLELERRAIEESDAVVAVSDELLEEMAGRYRLPEARAVFANYALRDDLPPLLAPRRRPSGEPPRLVYEGTLSTNGGHYDLREIFLALVAQGVTLDVYPSRDVPAYADLARRAAGLTYHERLPAPELLRRLPEYDFGWAGFNDRLNRPHIDTALPNKLFEYLACGLPVLTLGHRALERFLRERGLGIALGSPADLRAELARHDLGRLRERVAAARPTMTVEANIGTIVALYDELVASPVAAQA